MAYSTVAQVRDVCGLTTTDISDADLTDIITLADTRIDEIPAVTLTTDKKTLASAYLSSSMAMRQLSGKTAGSAAGSYSLGRLRVDKGSLATLRSNLADQFMEIFNQIITYGTDGTAVRKIFVEP